MVKRRTESEEELLEDVPATALLKKRSSVYCVRCNRFYPSDSLKKREYTAKKDGKIWKLVDFLCPVCGAQICQ